MCSHVVSHSLKPQSNKPNSLRFISYFSSQQCSTFMIAFGRKDYNLEWLPTTWADWLDWLAWIYDVHSSNTHGSYIQKLTSGYLEGSWDWVNWIKRISILIHSRLFFICWVRHVFFTSSFFKNSIYAWVRARFSLNLSRPFKTPPLMARYLTKASLLMRKIWKQG